MQLPDHVFGRRFAVCCHAEAEAEATVWDISEIALPEQCVIWQFVIRGVFVRASGDLVRVALGDQLPTTTAMMDSLEPLINGLGAQGPGPRAISVGGEASMMDLRLRMPVDAMGRKLVVELAAELTEAAAVDVYVVVSSLPKEVPDWMISA